VRGEAATVAGLLDAATRQIVATLGLDRREARLEARVLAARAWRVDPAWLLAHDADPRTESETATLQSLLSQRLRGMPIAYLLGTREFYGRPFAVAPGVLIPRPDTELLVELALARIPTDLATTILDLGTGSGCIAVTLALERPLARVAAVDRSSDALAIARRNADILNASVEFLVSDWFSALAGRQFDLVVGNPPYIAAADPHLTRGDLRFEPPSALVSGADGLDDLRRLIHAAGAFLEPGGAMLLEHGHDQAVAVRALLHAQGFLAPRSWPDLAGILRVSGGTLSE
jgi:release factor glutamine methyltransferase